MALTTKQRTRMGAGKRLTVAAVAAVLVLTGCAAQEDPAVEADSSAEQTDVSNNDNGLSAEDIASAIEPQGFECAVEEARGSARDEQVTCRGDDYVIITATSLFDESTMDDTVASAKRAICKNQDTLGIGAMRTAVSGKWVIVPGGDRDKDIAAFDTAMQELGLDWSEDSC